MAYVYVVTTCLVHKTANTGAQNSNLQLHKHVTT